MPPCLKRIQPMPNVPLAYVSVYRGRMSDIFHTLAYASTIRNSVTGPLVGQKYVAICKSASINPASKFAPYWHLYIFFDLKVYVFYNKSLKAM
jgi:hypothetical protein